MKPTHPCPPGAEPSPGQWLEQNDFALVVRLTPLVSIDLVVHDPDDRVLVGKRTHEPARNVYFVPGGRITKNETISAAFRRIARDELGIGWTVEESHFLGVFEHFYSQNRLESPGFGTHYVVLAYSLTLPSVPSRLPTDQHGHFAWMPVAELLARPDVHPNTKRYFQPAADNPHAP